MTGGDDTLFDVCSSFQSASANLILDFIFIKFMKSSNLSVLKTLSTIDFVNLVHSKSGLLMFKCAVCE